MSARYIVGDVRDVLATIPDGSIDLVLTSPPFLALRSYLPADHPDKHREIGSEPDPATFLDTLLLLTAEWGRVLAPHGSICVELGDTYSGSGNGDDPTYHPDGGNWSRRTPARGWPLPKSLCGIPHLYHLSLAYGRNLLTGEESPAGRWRVRNVVAWCRPNPPVGALGDKFRPATSYMTVATRAQKRYFDLDAVRTAHKDPTNNRAGKAKGGEDVNPSHGWGDSPGGKQNPAGAPPLDYWVIPPAPYSGSHYATFPGALCERPIKSMVPAKVCTVCGAPSERITSEPEYVSTTGGRVVNHFDGDRKGESVNAWEVDGGNPGHVVRSTTTIGWTDCGHDSWRNGVVLDPFAGSGTTLMVATGHGRDAIGIDIDARNADLALDRVGPLMLTVEHLADEVAS
jgi:DNA modification methylase